LIVLVKTANTCTCSASVTNSTALHCPAVSTGLFWR
jgi:hypothetical protein